MRDRALDAILEPLVQTGEEDPQAVAQAVLDALPDGERDRLLREMVMVRVRRSLSARGPRPGPPRPVAVPDPVEAPEVHRPVIVRPTALRPAQPVSTKVAGIRDWWSDLLSEPVSVGGREKVIADCTAADVDILARQRMAAAQRTAKQAHGMAALAAQMREHGARTVKDLPRTSAQRALAS